jgi:hypothetical protein
VNAIRRPRSRLLWHRTVVRHFTVETHPNTFEISARLLLVVTSRALSLHSYSHLGHDLPPLCRSFRHSFARSFMSGCARTAGPACGCMYSPGNNLSMPQLHWEVSVPL